jgi:hypothetical protein
MRFLPSTSKALIPVDDVVDNLPFIVRRDHRIVAAFARRVVIDCVYVRYLPDHVPSPAGGL